MGQVRNVDVLIGKINLRMKNGGHSIRFRDEEDESNPTSGYIKSNVGFCMRYKTPEEAHSILNEILYGGKKN